MLKEIELKRFLIHVDSRYTFSNFTVFIGENGSGKSSILEAIAYALFGSVSRKVNKSDLVTTGYEGDSYVSLITDDFEVKRSIRGSDSYLKDFTTLTVYKTITDINSFINQRLGVDSSHFFNLFYISQGHLLDIVNTTSSERKKLMDKLFFPDLSFDVLYNALSFLENKYKDDYGSIDIKKSSLAEKKKKIHIVSSTIVKIQKELDELKQVLDEKKSKLTSLQILLDKINEQKKLLDERDYIKNRISEFESYILCEEDLQKYKDLYVELKQKISDYTKQQKNREVYDLLFKLNDIWLNYISYDHNKYIKELSKQDLSKDVLLKIQNSRRLVFDCRNSDFDTFIECLKKHENLILLIGSNETFTKDNDYLTKNKFLYENYSKLKSLLNEYKVTTKHDLENLLYVLNKKISSSDDFGKLQEEFYNVVEKLKAHKAAKQELVKLRARLNEITEKLNSLNVDVDTTDVISKIGVITNDVQSVSAMYEKVNEQLYQLKYEKQILENDIENLQSEINNLEKKYSKYVIFLSLKRLFHKDGLPSAYRRSVYEPLVHKIRSYIESFGFTIDINIDEDFNFTTSISKSVDSLSGGQKVILALAVRFAVADLLGVKSKFLLIDEPTVHLDSIRVNELVEVIKELAKKIQIVLVTHRDEFIDISGSQVYELR